MPRAPSSRARRPAPPAKATANPPASLGSAGRRARPDGDDTRERLLEVAGRLCAERGVAHATSKEICARAGTNLAAVNYHFGSRDGLYAAVLVEAHRQLVALEDLQRVAAGPGTPRARLQRLLRELLGRAAAPRAPWGLPVLVREMMSPSAQLPALVRDAIVPKAQVLMSLLAQVLGLPPAHPGVQRALVFTVLPCLLVVVAPPPLRRAVLPALDAEPQALVEEMVAHAMAGLAALARRHARAAS